MEAGVTPRLIHAYDVVGGGTRLGGKRTLIDAGPGTPDGLRVDVDGNLWVGWGMGEEGLDGVSVFNPDGKPIGRIDLPERCANLCFGGRAAQPAVHVRQHVAVLAVREHPGRRRRLRRATHFPAVFWRA